MSQLLEKQYLMLSQLAYLDFVNEEGNNNNMGLFEEYSLEEIADYILNNQNISIIANGGLSEQGFKALLEDIKNDSVLKNLKLSGTGFVAYAFENEYGDTYCAFAGFKVEIQGGHEGGFLGLLRDLKATVDPYLKTDGVDKIYNMVYKDFSNQFFKVEQFVNKLKGSGDIYVAWN